MSILREIFLLLRNTLLVTALAYFGLAMGSAIGVPSWLLGLCFVPAVVLFHWLSSDARPQWRETLGFAGIFTVLVTMLGVTLPLVPEPYRDAVFLLLVLVFPVDNVVRRLGNAFQGRSLNTTPRGQTGR
ncbi:hypothetical protein [Verrucomicrobium sp. BvORR034]|uniref:hypothetical protein n=1 Tax=Verrucomicrobium sp. BvORR034 TaxID=1396418 RepID=UPI0006789620|nr:hypothetical protein [Verrucomicrobium sp. BvORR034]